MFFSPSSVQIKELAQRLSLKNQCAMTRFASGRIKSHNSATGINKISISAINF